MSTRKVWICDACDELVSRAEGATDGHCAGSLTMGHAHERQPMRATTVVEESELQDVRAELESLRDFKDLLAFVDDADQPVFKSWEQAHKHHADEPYIGCVFCRDKFVLAERACPAAHDSEEDSR